MYARSTSLFKAGEENEEKQADYAWESWLLMEWSSRHLQGGARDRICHDLCLPGRYVEAQWVVLARNIMLTFNAYLYLKIREGNKEL